MANELVSAHETRIRIDQGAETDWNEIQRLLDEAISELTTSGRRKWWEWLVPVRDKHESHSEQVLQEISDLRARIGVLSGSSAPKACELADGIATLLERLRNCPPVGSPWDWFFFIENERDFYDAILSRVLHVLSVSPNTISIQASSTDQKVGQRTIAWTVICKQYVAEFKAAADRARQMLDPYGAAGIVDKAWDAVKPKPKASANGCAGLQKLIESHIKFVYELFELIVPFSLSFPVQELTGTLRFLGNNRELGEFIYLAETSTAIVPRLVIPSQGETLEPLPHDRPEAYLLELLQLPQDDTGKISDELLAAKLFANLAGSNPQSIAHAYAKYESDIRLLHAFLTWKLKPVAKYFRKHDRLYELLAQKRIKGEVFPILKAENPVAFCRVQDVARQFLDRSNFQFYFDREHIEYRFDPGVSEVELEGLNFDANELIRKAKTVRLAGPAPSREIQQAICTTLRGIKLEELVYFLRAGFPDSQYESWCSRIVRSLIDYDRRGKPEENESQLRILEGFANREFAANGSVAAEPLIQIGLLPVSHEHQSYDEWQWAPKEEAFSTVLVFQRSIKVGTKCQEPLRVLSRGPLPSLFGDPDYPDFRELVSMISSRENLRAPTQSGRTVAANFLKVLNDLPDNVKEHPMFRQKAAVAAEAFGADLQPAVGKPVTVPGEWEYDFNTGVGVGEAYSIKRFSLSFKQGTPSNQEFVEVGTPAAKISKGTRPLLFNEVEAMLDQLAGGVMDPNKKQRFQNLQRSYFPPPIRFSSPERADDPISIWQELIELAVRSLNEAAAAGRREQAAQCAESLSNALRSSSELRASGLAAVLLPPGNVTNIADLDRCLSEIRVNAPASRYFSAEKAAEYNEFVPYGGVSRFGNFIAVFQSVAKSGNATGELQVVTSLGYESVQRKLADEAVEILHGMGGCPWVESAALAGIQGQLCDVSVTVACEEKSREIGPGIVSSDLAMIELVGILDKACDYLRTIDSSAFVESLHDLRQRIISHLSAKSDVTVEEVARSTDLSALPEHAIVYYVAADETAGEGNGVVDIISRSCAAYGKSVQAPFRVLIGCVGVDREQWKIVQSLYVQLYNMVGGSFDRLNEFLKARGEYARNRSAARLMAVISEAEGLLASDVGDKTGQSPAIAREQLNRLEEFLEAGGIGCVHLDAGYPIPSKYQTFFRLSRERVEGFSSNSVVRVLSPAFFDLATGKLIGSPGKVVVA